VEITGGVIILEVFCEPNYHCPGSADMSTTSSPMLSMAYCHIEYTESAGMGMCSWGLIGDGIGCYLRSQWHLY